jgi:hypothetical protein
MTTGGEIKIPCYPDKAAILLGMLSELANDRPNILSDDDLAKFREIGKKALKQNSA